MEAPFSAVPTKQFQIRQRIVHNSTRSVRTNIPNTVRLSFTFSRQEERGTALWRTTTATMTPVMRKPNLSFQRCDAPPQQVLNLVFQESRRYDVLCVLMVRKRYRILSMLSNNALLFFVAVSSLFPLCSLSVNSIILSLFVKIFFSLSFISHRMTTANIRAPLPRPLGG